jgi:hypothetical protein
MFDLNLDLNDEDEKGEVRTSPRGGLGSPTETESSNEEPEE